MYNVIGDIAGNFLTLQALLAQMPEAPLLCLGDLNDRGPRSKEVIEFVMKNGESLNSNHGHMFVDTWKQVMLGDHIPYYEGMDLFLMNGGGATLKSYQIEDSIPGIDIMSSVPREHIQWLETRPMYVETDKLIFTHAPLHWSKTPEQASQLGNGFTRWSFDADSEYSVLWNRYVPDKPHPYGKINVFGHNASTQVKVYTPKYPNSIKIEIEQFAEFVDDAFALCIDTAAGPIESRKLTGLHVPTMTLYQQEYID